VSARNRELFGLVPASLLVAAGFAAIFIQQGHRLSGVSLTYGGAFLALFLVAHMVVRYALPYADPYLLPLAAALSSFGLVEIYRISQTLARQQATWFLVGLVCFVATIVLARDYRKLERYRYTIAFVSVAILFAPRLPGIGQQVNGAYLNIHFGSISFQPAELGKIGIVIFLASYLRDTRQVLVQGARRFLGVTFPPLRHFGPLLLVWGAAMATLIYTRELGTSLMFYGAFIAILYVATSRASFPLIGLALFGLGAWFIGTHVPHVHDRVQAWLDPFAPGLYDKKFGGSYQLVQGLFAQADGGLFGQGFAGSALDFPGGGRLLPVPESDFIYAVITNEVGLFGAAAIILTYLIFVQRGFKIALLARDSFSTLLAVGLTTVVALQVFIIVGGVTRLIPLTGVTLPFISKGGSSVIMNFVLVALLLLISDRARRPT
jgi:cell division protein FtsW (lipid II flippase)